MEIPTTLHEWSLEIIKNLLDNGIYESDIFDFKQSLPHNKDESSKKRLKKTMAAFANSGGGFLIFGISYDKNMKTEERLIGISNVFDFPVHFGYYPSSCEPNVHWEFLNPPIYLNEDRCIHVCEIKSIWKRPHAVLMDESFIFPKRTHKGNENMSYSELRSAFQEAEYRRTKLALLISELEHMKEVAQNLLDNVPENIPLMEGTLRQAWITRYNTTLLDMVLGDAYSFIAEKPEVWELLCQIRMNANVSNSACDAFSNVVLYQ